jgi:hypothetical protein
MFDFGDSCPELENYGDGFMNVGFLGKLTG